MSFKNDVMFTSMACGVVALGANNQSGRNSCTITINVCVCERERDAWQHTISFLALACLFVPIVLILDSFYFMYLSLSFSVLL